MVSQVTFGNLSTTNGRTTVSGTSSGIDSASLIEELATAKRVPAVALEGQIETNLEKIGKFNEFTTALTAFQAAADLLRNPPGVLNSSSNAFEYRNIDMTADNGDSAENYLSITAEAGADIGVYDITVTSVAEAKQQRIIGTGGAPTNFQVSDPSEAIVAAAPGATDMLLKAGTVAGVTFNDGDSMATVVQKVNANSDTLGITAQIVQVDDDEFTMLFTATSTGLAADFDMNATPDPDGVFQNVTFSDTQNAANASITLNNISITRQTNIFDDVIEGVDFEVKQLTGGVTLTAEIEADTAFARDAIINFANAYNDIRVFAAEQTQRGEDGAFNEEALLGSDSTFQTIVNRVADEVTLIVENITGGYDDLTDIGISFDDYAGDAETPETTNIMTVDTAALESALANDFDEVREVFEFRFTADSSDITIFSRTNNHTATEFTIDVAPGTTTATATIGADVYNLDYDAFTGGATLSGQEGTPLEGLVFIYASTSNASIDVSISQGVGDRLYNAIEDMLDDEDGLLTSTLESLSDSNDNLQENIDRIDEQIESYRESLVLQFSRLESALSSVNSVLQLLDAQNQAYYAANG